MTSSPIHEITSSENRRVKLLRAIGASRGIRRHRRALVCGRRLVEELLRRHPGLVESLVYPIGDAALSRDREANGIAGGSTMGDLRVGLELLALPPALFREIDPVGVEPPLGVIRVEPPATWDPERDRGGLTLFLPLGDPENAGAALRSAAAFEVDRVVLLAEAANPFLPRAIRAAAGACFDLELRSGPALDDLLARIPAGLELCLLDRAGELVSSLVASPDRGLVVGEEGRGVPPADAPQPSVATPSGGGGPRSQSASGAAPGVRRVTIPISDRVESLNAAVAVGIALWELRRR